MKRPNTFRIPILLAVLSAAGLTSALLGDGIWDGLSWLALGVPAIISISIIIMGAFPGSNHR